MSAIRIINEDTNVTRTYRLRNDKRISRTMATKSQEIKHDLSQEEADVEIIDLLSNYGYRIKFDY